MLRAVLADRSRLLHRVRGPRKTNALPGRPLQRRSPKMIDGSLCADAASGRCNYPVRDYPWRTVTCTCCDRRAGSPRAVEAAPTGRRVNSFEVGSERARRPRQHAGQWWDGSCSITFNDYSLGMRYKRPRSRGSGKCRERARRTIRRALGDFVLGARMRKAASSVQTQVQDTDIERGNRFLCAEPTHTRCHPAGVGAAVTIRGPERTKARRRASTTRMRRREARNGSAHRRGIDMPRLRRRPAGVKRRHYHPPSGATSRG